MSYGIYLILYGVLLTAVLGLSASWLDRKVTARVQYRVGPPFLQPVIDLVKLSGKETLIPTGASALMFLGAPLLGLAGVIAVSTMLWVGVFHPGESFVGDIIVVVYLLTLPSMSVILGGMASGNPLASLGASREMKLVLAYELPFVLAMLTPVISSGFSIRFGQIVASQAENGAVVLSASGVLAFVVAVLCAQAKLALVPFDIPDAETEIVGGPLVEYSGPALALFRLTKSMLLFTLPFLLTVLFLGGVRMEGAGLLWGLLKIVGIVAVITVVRNTNPRVRIDQAVRFFWGPVTALAAMAVGLALLGW